MRQITLKEEKTKENRTKQLLVGGILIFIMLFSVLGYGFQGRGEGASKKIDYNGFEFVNSEGFWTLKDQNLVFKYNPLQVEEIDANLKDINNYFDKPLYISSGDREAESDIYTNLNPVVQRIQYACLNGEVCNDETLPIKTCQDNFIIIQEAEENSITQEENCVFIKGTNENLTKLSDEFLFHILGIREQ